MPSQAAASRRSLSHQTASGAQHGREDSTAGTTSVLDDPKYAIATNFLATMLHEVVIDTALLIHAQVKRQRRTEGKIAGGCPVCKTSCQKKSSESVNGEKMIKTEAAEERETSPVLTQEISTTPKGLEMYQNNPLLACLVCSRQVSANRYAQHLASCVGVGGKGGNGRRKGKNGLNITSFAKDRIKIKTALENRKKANFQTQSNRNTPTPFTKPEQESISGTSDDEISNNKKRTLADSLGLNGNGKRILSPSLGDNSKRAKHGNKANSPRNGSRNSTQTFAPYALGSSLPVTGSPLNPYRNNKPATVVEDDDDEEDNDDDDEDDEEEEEEEDDDDDDEEDDDDDDNEDDDEDDEDDASLALAHGTSTLNRNNSIADSFDDDSDDARSEAVSDNASFIASKSTKSSKASKAAGTIERSKGSDGEYISVESASEVDDDF